MDEINQLTNQLTKSQTPSSLFYPISQLLLSKVSLVVNSIRFRLIEIEFYLYNNKHTDIFAHKFNCQKMNLHWYFHRSSEKEHSYKGGTFKGLDLTCGSDDSYGGILIRSIMDLSNNKIIEGPCKIVEKILEITKCISIKDLVLNKMNNDISVHHPLLCLKDDQHSLQDIFRSPRIGLTLKKSDNIELRRHYICQPYRFLIFPSSIKKGKKMILYIAINEKSTHIINQYFNYNQQQIDSINKIIDCLRNTTLDQSKFTDLTDDQRLQIFFNQSHSQFAGIKKIKIQLKKTNLNQK